MNIVRKAIRKLGFDLHRYRPRAEHWDYLKSLNIETILDIGANTGQFATEARSKMPKAQIYSYEPIKECFEKIKMKFSSDNKFKAFNFALGDSPIGGEKIEINKSSYSPSSSILEMSEVHKTLFPHTREHTKENIEVKRLDEVVKEIDLKKEILIKVDVQGLEEKVIRGGIETFKKAKVVLIENSFVELYKNQATFAQIYDSLKTLGFSYRGSLQQKVDRDSGEIISEDSIFIK